MSEPTNKKLYSKVRAEAKRKFDVWPSAYASSWLVREYKRRGGKYKSSNKSNKRNSSLSRWHKEKWIDVCQLPKKVSCGRSKSNARKYPYCRPSVRVNSKTPKTYKQYSKAELKKRCSRKRRSPSKKIK